MSSQPSSPASAQGTNKSGRVIAALLHGAGRIPGASVFTRLHARLFRRTRGRAVRRWFGAPVMVLEVVGRRTGRTRATSVVYLPLDDGYVVTAANAGNDRTPQWWLNLQAAGAAVAHVRGRREEVVPRLLDGDERNQRWAQLAAAYPSIGHYPSYTDRVFPVIHLHRV